MKQGLEFSIQLHNFVFFPCRFHTSLNQRNKYPHAQKSNTQWNGNTQCGSLYLHRNENANLNSGDGNECSFEGESPPSERARNSLVQKRLIRIHSRYSGEGGQYVILFFLTVKHTFQSVLFRLFMFQDVSTCVHLWPTSLSAGRCKCPVFGPRAVFSGLTLPGCLMSHWNTTPLLRCFRYSSLLKRMTSFRVCK